MVKTPSREGWAMLSAAEELRIGPAV